MKKSLTAALNEKDFAKLRKTFATHVAAIDRLESTFFPYMENPIVEIGFLPGTKKPALHILLQEKFEMAARAKTPEELHALPQDHRDFAAYLKEHMPEALTVKRPHPEKAGVVLKKKVFAVTYSFGTTPVVG